MAQLAMAIPAVLTVASTVMGAKAQREQGKQEQANAYEEAEQLDINAGQQVAAAQRSAMEHQREGRLAQSRALAVAAASGGGASDPTVINIISQLAGETAYRGMVDLYQGQEESRNMRLEAENMRRTGDASRKAGNQKSFATVLDGASSLFSKYGPKRG